MSPSLKHLGTLALFLLSGCNKTSAPAPEGRVISMSPPPSTSPKLVLAHLNEFLPRVTFRRSDEMAWGEASVPLALYAFDSVKTHARAKARVLFRNGSELELREETLIIINPASLTLKTKRDIARVNEGQLRGWTKHELWLLSRTALLRMRARGKTEIARASLRLRKDRKLEVKLEMGEATLLVKKEGGEVKPITLTLSQPAVMSLPDPKEVQEWTDQELDEQLQLAEVEPPPTVPKAMRKPAVASTHHEEKKIEIAIISPPNYSELAGDSIELKGKVSGEGGRVLISGKQVAIDKDLGFVARVPLSKGPNNIPIQLIRPEGESEFRRWIVIRKDN